jgi:hypothetical protein
MRGEADRPDVRSEQEQGQVPDTPHHTKDDARAQGAPDSLQKGQSKPTPSDLLAPRTAREELVPRMISGDVIDEFSPVPVGCGYCGRGFSAVAALTLATGQEGRRGTASGSVGRHCRASAIVPRGLPARRRPAVRGAGPYLLKRY